MSDSQQLHAEVWCLLLCCFVPRFVWLPPHSNLCCAIRAVFVCVVVVVMCVYVCRVLDLWNETMRGTPFVFMGLVCPSGLVRRDVQEKLQMRSCAEGTEVHLIF